KDREVTETLVQIRPRLPEWARNSATHYEALHRLKAGFRQLNLHTVCESARCPNIHECFARGAATFMILGNLCTRGCGFCSVPKGSPAKQDMRLDPAEPANVARMAAAMNLRYVVITSVNRDDLRDGGSAHFAETVRQVRHALPDARVEVLTPDFCGDLQAVARVLDAGPHVFNHNIETAPRLYGRVRPQANYRQSLDVLDFARRYRPGILTKSGLMAGLGETEEEVHAVLRDLRAAGTAVATIGQYLRPTRRNLPVAAYIEPRQFDRYREYGLSIGFPSVFRAGGAGAPAGGRGPRAAVVAPLSAGSHRGRGLLVRRLLLDPGRAGILWRPQHSAGLARVSALLPDQSAAHGGIRDAGRHPDATLVGRARGGRAMGLDRSHPRIARFRVAGAWQCRHRHGVADASRALRQRLRPVVR